VENTFLQTIQPTRYYEATVQWRLPSRRYEWRASRPSGAVWKRDCASIRTAAAALALDPPELRVQRDGVTGSLQFLVE
jgi:hypothetical protein